MATSQQRKGPPAFVKKFQERFPDETSAQRVKGFNLTLLARGTQVALLIAGDRSEFTDKVTLDRTALFSGVIKYGTRILTQFLKLTRTQIRKELKSIIKTALRPDGECVVDRAVLLIWLEELLFDIQLNQRLPELDFGAGYDFRKERDTILHTLTDISVEPTIALAAARPHDRTRTTIHPLLLASGMPGIYARTSNPQNLKSKEQIRVTVSEVLQAAPQFMQFMGSKDCVEVDMTRLIDEVTKMLYFLQYNLAQDYDSYYLLTHLLLEVGLRDEAQSAAASASSAE